MNPCRHSKLAATVTKGDVCRHEVAGAGGWGDPLERDPALVLKGVLNEFVSERGAREDYGVVVARKPLAVDAAATAALRRRMRGNRKWDEVPVYSRVVTSAAE